MIFLDEQTRPYLKSLLEKKVKQSPLDFVAKRLIKSVEAEEERLELQHNCQHEKVELVGKKTCCGKCEAYFETGMGFEWTNKEYL